MKAYIYFRSALDFGWNVIFDNKLLHGMEYLTSQGKNRKMQRLYDSNRMERKIHFLEKLNDCTLQQIK